MRELLRFPAHAHLFAVAVQHGAHARDLLTRAQHHLSELPRWWMHQVMVRLPLLQARLLRAASLLQHVPDGAAGPLIERPDGRDEVEALVRAGLAERRDAGGWSVPRCYRELVVHPDSVPVHRLAARLLRHHDPSAAFAHALLADDLDFARAIVIAEGVTACFAGHLDRVGTWLVQLPSELRFGDVNVALISLLVTALRRWTVQLGQHLGARGRRATAPPLETRTSPPRPALPGARLSRPAGRPLGRCPRTHLPGPAHRRAHAVRAWP